MSLTLDTQPVGDVTVVQVSGRIVLGDGADTLRDAVRKLAKDGCQKILLNFANVSSIDSSGLGMLVSAYATVTGQGAQLKLMNVTTRVKNLLLITKLYTVFEVFDDELAALRSFAPVPVAEAMR